MMTDQKCTIGLFIIVAAVTQLIFLYRCLQAQRAWRRERQRVEREFRQADREEGKL